LNMAENLQNFIERRWPPGSVAHPFCRAEVVEKVFVRRKLSCASGSRPHRREATSATAEALLCGGVKARHPLMRADAQVVAQWSPGIVLTAPAAGQSLLKQLFVRWMSSGAL
jgi:hypothetical protein